MITKTGKNILAKYLIGQAPAYASYLAIGCGTKPLNTNESFPVNTYAEKNRLDFEMFRVPIISRGYVNEDGIDKIVFTAELPSEERYEISEVGVFSAGANAAVGAYDSKSIYAFTQDENWEYHITYPEEDAGAYELFTKYNPLDDDHDNIISDFEQTVGNKSFIAKIFQTNADNTIFTNTQRLLRYERCRFFNNVIIMRGDSSTLSIDNNNHLVVGSESSHIHLTGATLDFNKNSPTDELKLAFSVINKDGESTQIPDSVRVLVEFASSDVHNSGEWARFEVILENGTANGQFDFESNRYIVSTKQLQELYKSNGFTWSSVDVVKIYSTVIANNVASDNFYVCLDAVRLENNSTANSLYGLTGYSVIKNTNAETIVKAANTTNYIEFRFAMDVQ